jgi:hypothetical protein
LRFGLAYIAAYCHYLPVEVRQCHIVKIYYSEVLYACAHKSFGAPAADTSNAYKQHFCAI